MRSKVAFGRGGLATKIKAQPDRTGYEQDEDSDGEYRNLLHHFCSVA